MVSEVSHLSVVCIFVPGFLNVVSSVSKTTKILRGMSGLIVSAHNGFTVRPVEETEVAPQGRPLE